MKRCRNAKILCVALIGLYFFLPIMMAPLFPDNFYIFSSRAANGIWEIGLTGMALLLWIFLIFKNIGAGAVRVKNDALRLLSWFWNLSTLYLSLVAVWGVLHRAAHPIDRIELAALEHRFLFPGLTIILTLSLCYLILNGTRRKVVVTTLLYVILDLIFLGKIFAFLAAFTFVFWMDYKYSRKSMKPFLYTVAGGIVFILVIFFSRAYYADGSFSLGVSAYSLFSEFMGVFATVGWAKDHAYGALSLFHTGEYLRTIYLDTTGHGLAIHPVAYFIATMGAWWWMAFAAFLACVLGLVHLSKFMIGDLAVFVVLINMQHFFRHGPDIFLKNVIVGIAAVILVAGVHYRLIFGSRRSFLPDIEAENS